MPSINAKKIAQIRRLASSGYTTEQIRKITGVGRHSIEAIRAGKKRDCNGLYVGKDEEITTPPGVYVRCGGCGGKVQLPCLLCKQRRIESEENVRKFRHISEK